MTPQLKTQKPQPEQAQRHTLPPLPYEYAALEPHIDAQTMQIHHGKHHQAYVNNLNAALDKHPELLQWSLEDLLRKINQIPEDIRTAVRNNAGGHHNHSLFWTIMAPSARSGGESTGALADALKNTFAGVDRFKEQLAAARRGLAAAHGRRPHGPGGVRANRGPRPGSPSPPCRRPAGTHRADRDARNQPSTGAGRARSSAARRRNRVPVMPQT